MDRRAQRARTLSLWLPGLGQLYNGDWVKGAGLAAAASLLASRAAQQYSLASAAGTAVVSPLRLALYAGALLLVWAWGVHDVRRSPR